MTVLLGMDWDAKTPRPARVTQIIRSMYSEKQRKAKEHDCGRVHRTI